ncbi:hypothetical protein [Polyangium sp. y55x31]|uniref:hypothetical protein n=1 Tax=Polyangium sp. y55x31 TaxID=3042688 RepID=UPI0024829161|nr:hypothetical protein [Polyangium sp. y55x31]MDI1480078.1 hypothetical protein [Polyangium sp. y55x31]
MRPEPASIEPCPLCERPNLNPSDHHLVPRSRGGKLTLAICRDCHHAVHAVLTNKELEARYHTVAELVAHPELAKMIAFIARQDPGGRVRMRRTKSRPRRP